MKYWKNKIVYDDELKSIKQELVEVEGSKIDYHVDRMSELTRRRDQLNDTFFRGGMRHHMSEIEKLLTEEEKAEKETDNE